MKKITGDVWILLYVTSYFFATALCQGKMYVTTIEISQGISTSSHSAFFSFTFLYVETILCNMARSSKACFNFHYFFLAQKCYFSPSKTMIFTVHRNRNVLFWVFMYFSLFNFKTIRNHKTMIQITKKNK